MRCRQVLLRLFLNLNQVAHLVDHAAVGAVVVHRNALSDAPQTQRLHSQLLVFLLADGLFFKVTLSFDIA